MSKSVFDGAEAKGKLRGLAAALDDDNAALIRHRWATLGRIVNLAKHHDEIRRRLTDEQAARLARMTSFEA